MRHKRLLAALAVAGMGVAGCGERVQEVRHGHPAISDLDERDSAQVRAMLEEALRTERPGSDGDSDAEIVLGTLFLGGKLDRIEALLVEQNHMLRAIVEHAPHPVDGHAPAPVPSPQRTR